MSTRALGASAELRTLTRGWRLRLDRRTVPGLPQREGKRQRVSQAEVASLVGVSLTWYGGLERGEINPGYSDAFLDAVADVLRLDCHERNVLYQLAAGRDAVPSQRPPALEVDETVQRIIDQSGVPAWCQTPAGDVVAWNAEAARWFPHLSYERNMVRWICVYPEAQTKLLAWETDWAMPMIAQVRAALPRWGSDPMKDVLAEAVNAVPAARAGWRRTPCIIDHLDDRPRGLHVPFQQEPVVVQVIVMDLPQNPRIRVMQLLPQEQQPSA
ncbi:helix-turn-helix domain-containing protein [Catellatospora chokoriensis]|uniref:helix-turn-helix domain-containing protein n=1 Tax=Catellatospora chokoriensis TaxID=310353 RepID=UPI0017845456|nr:helix-turn-helix domain-containing protein [Catellatospora chokoriensis]